MVAGELLYGKSCSGHNDVIKNVPDAIPISYVASANGLSGVDEYHFNRDGYLKLGARYAEQMMKGLREYEKVEVSQPKLQRVINASTVTLRQNNVSVYTLDGKFISSGLVHTAMKPGNMYVVFNTATGASTMLMMAPSRR